jgi:hypothetical protein
VRNVWQQYAIGIASTAILASASTVSAADRFVDVEIETPFAEALTKHRLLMSAAGAKIIVLPDGRRLVIAVGQTPYNENASAADRLAMLTVVKVNALREAAARDASIQVVNVEKSLESSRVETVDGVEARGAAISEYLSMTEASFAATVRGMRPVGQWYSRERDMLYLAMGVELPAPERP